MNQLLEIKSKAQDLFAQKDMKSVLEFLLAQLEKVDDTLYNEVILFESKRNLLNQENEDKLITKEHFNVHQNRLHKSINEFIDDLDTPQKRRTNQKKLSKEQLITIILIVQLFILFGIGMLIYLQLR